MKFKKIIIAKIILYSCVLLIVLKILLTIIENSILNIIKSNRFHDFLINQVEYHINKYANSLESDFDRQVTLQESLRKIIIKWKPFFDQLPRDIY